MIKSMRLASQVIVLILSEIRSNAFTVGGFATFEVSAFLLAFTTGNVAWMGVAIAIAVVAFFKRFIFTPENCLALLLVLAGTEEDIGLEEC